MKNTICEECKLYPCTFVPPQYAGKVKILFIGEAPGEEEERQGVPFIGRSGMKLREQISLLLKETSFTFGITNTVKCRPPQNETPTADIAKKCNYYLAKDFEIADPDIVVPLGLVAYRSLGFNDSLKSAVNRTKKINLFGKERIVIPTYHPAAVLHNPVLVFEFKKTFEILKTILDSSFTLPEFTYQILQGKNEDYDILIDFISNVKCFAFDLETTSFSPFASNSRIISVGLSGRYKDGNLYSLSLDGTRWEESTFYDILRVIFENDIPKVAHNAKFDMKWLKYFGIKVCGLIFDTIIAHYLLDENLPHSLSFIASEMGVVSYKESFWGDVKDSGAADLSEYIFDKDGNILADKIENLLVYNAKDAFITYIAYERLSKLLENDPPLKALHNNLYLPLVDTFIDMELRGMKINVLKLENLITEYKKRMKEIVIKLKNLEEVKKWEKTTGKEFNPNSSIQISEILELNNFNTGKRTPKTGRVSTNEESLLNIAGNSFADLLLEYRRLQKMTSTFLEKFKDMLSIDGCIHPSFNLIGTVTGRVSCERPNLQQIPKDSEIKVIFVPQNDLLLEVDYSQMELRVVASLSQDPEMIKAYNENIDLHTLTSSIIFNKPIEKITEEERKIGKTINFGIVYGITPAGLANRIKLATGKEISEKEAKVYIKRFFDTYRNVYFWAELQKAFARQMKYVVTPFGKKRHFSSETTEEEIRQAVNAPVQSTAAYITLTALLGIDREIKANGLKSFVVNTVHDSILIDVILDELPYVVNIVNEITTKRIKEIFKFIKVPLEVDIKCGASWGNLESLEKFKNIIHIPT